MSRGPIWRRESRSLGTKLKPQKIEFGAFIGPSGQNQLYHTPLLLKIWDLTKNEKIVNNPFKSGRHWEEEEEEKEDNGEEDEDDDKDGRISKAWSY